MTDDRQSQIQEIQKEAGSSAKEKKRQKRPPKKISKRYLTNAGLYYLQRFPASTFHFRKVMARKIKKSIDYHGSPLNEEANTYLDEVVEDFQRLGYLNDEAYTSSIIRSLKARGASALKIKAKLREKGILHVPTEDKMLQLASDTEELKSAVKLLKRRRRGPFLTGNKKPVSGSEEEQDLNRKTLALLARNGFSYPVCQKALDMSLEEAQDILFSFTEDF
ncbi:MAG: hypothetical protein CMH28_06655 [Micavibrio sp.]|nr:hypothetical protein [Micavibrio sp.]